jgi:23S rRNA (uridine2552-2'-O)-methyltransferase
MSFKVKDRFYHKAKEEGFAARSVYKLQELDQKSKFIKASQTVVDLGCAPGSWSQWLSQKLGPQGQVIGFDITSVTLKLPNATFYQADLLQTNVHDFLKEHNHPCPVDGVVSDMAPKTTGIRDVDQARSLELCQMALQTAEQILKPGGYFVCKIFQSKDFDLFRNELKQRFAKLDVLKPESTRSRSYEIFLVGLRYKPVHKS